MDGVQKKKFKLKFYVNGIFKGACIAAEKRYKFCEQKTKEYTHTYLIRKRIQFTIAY